jgi:hypothetical protein
VHEPAGVGRADVHARPLADRLETLEDEQVLGVVGVVDDGSAFLSALPGAFVRNLLNGTDGPDADAPPIRRNAAASRVMDVPVDRLKVTNLQIRSHTGEALPMIVSALRHTRYIVHLRAG